MKKNQPKYYPNAKVTCATTGKVFSVGSVLPDYKVEITSACHPYYMGQNAKRVATGRVEKFYNKYKKPENNKVSEDSKENQ